MQQAVLATRVGANIARWRQRRDLSSRELGLMTQADSSQIEAYEAGQSLPDLPTLILIAGALGLRPAKLLGDVNWQMLEQHPDR